MGPSGDDNFGAGGLRFMGNGNMSPPIIAAQVHLVEHLTTGPGQHASNDVFSVAWNKYKRMAFRRKAAVSRIASPTL